MGEQLVVDQVLLECVEEGFFGGVRDGAACGSAAVVDQDVNVVGFDDAFGDALHLVGALKVRDGHLVAFTGQRGECFVEAVEVAGEQRDACTKSGELLSRCQTNALGSAAHQGMLAAQIQGQNVEFLHAAKGRRVLFWSHEAIGTPRHMR